MNLMHTYEDTIEFPVATPFCRHCGKLRSAVEHGPVPTGVTVIDGKVVFSYENT